MEKYYTIFKQLMGAQKNWVLGISAFAGLIICWECRFLFANRSIDPSEARVLVAVRDLPAGQSMGLADYTIIPESLLKQRPAGHLVTDQDIHRVQGSRLKGPLDKGAVLTADLLERGRVASYSQRIPPGSRAYFVRAENVEFLRPGEHVDLYLKPNSKGAQVVSLAEGLLVLSVVEDGERRGASLAVSAEDIQLLEKALEQGKLILALRNPEEQTSKNKLKNRWRPASKGRSAVEIITEDK